MSFMTSLYDEEPLGDLDSFVSAPAKLSRAPSPAAKPSRAASPAKMVENAPSPTRSPQRLSPPNPPKSLAVDPVLEKKSSDASKLGKIFMGGLKSHTTKETAIAYFSQYGSVKEANIMTDPQTQTSRGYGFLVFSDPSVVPLVLAQPHVLDGKRIDVKKAILKDNVDENLKVFVGGLPSGCTEGQFQEYFAKFGTIVQCNYLMDRATGRPRGYGFITFDSQETVDQVINAQKRGDISILGKRVDVKVAQPKKQTHNQQSQPRFNQNQNPQMVPMMMPGMNGMPGMMPMPYSNRPASPNTAKAQLDYYNAYVAMAAQAQFAGYYAGYDPAAYMAMQQNMPPPESSNGASRSSRGKSNYHPYSRN